MNLPIYTVDAFAVNGQQFTGNGAAVCILESDDCISDVVKQKIAFEMNLSETAYVAKSWDTNSKLEDNQTYTLRWFTPRTEVELCGHATLASAKVIYEQFYKHNISDTQITIKFVTKYMGTLAAIVNPINNKITLDFPLQDCIPIDRQSDSWIDSIIEYTLGSNMDPNLIQDIEYSSEIKYLLLRLKDCTESESLITKVSPNFDKLLSVKTNKQIIGIIVTQKGYHNRSEHFFSRFFGPNVGINEDPVTGSAHAVLTPYWVRDYNKNGQQVDDFIAKQCSQRGGLLSCKIVGQRVHITGEAIVFMNGFLSL